MTSTVYIAKSVYGGDGLGRLGDGRVVFVPGAFAGESVKAEVVGEKRRYVNARLVEVVEPSAERIDGGAVAGIPGCVYANLSATGETEAKRQQLADALERARLAVPGGVGAPEEGVPKDVEAMLHYRNKASYHFGRKGGGWVMGYRSEPGHEIVDVTDDPLVVREINAALPEIRRSVFALLANGAPAVRRDIEQKGRLTVRFSRRTGVKWWVGDAPRDVVIKEETAGRVFEVPSDGFYQVNPAVGEQLVKAVCADYAAHRAAAPHVLDLYCGVGVFGLCCRGKGDAARLTGVESGRLAVDFARRNAAAQGVQATFFAEQTVLALKRRALAPDARTTVIVDPPRGGMEPGVAKALVRSDAARILSVSCDPATLVRDLRELCTVFEIEKVNWFNMFPRTARFETLVVLRRRLR